MNSCKLMLINFFLFKYLIYKYLLIIKTFVENIKVGFSNTISLST